MIYFNEKEVKIDKIVCIGRNYVEHIEELKNEIPKNLLIFNKPYTSISKGLVFPKESCRFEGELCFLFDRLNIRAVGFGLDLTLDELQEYLKAKSLPWERAKSFKNSVVFSKFVSFNNMNDLSFKLFINNKLRQFAKLEFMINKPKDIAREVDDFQGLNNDVIMTGTPKGVGKLILGDLFEVVLYEKEKILLSQEWIVK